MEKIIIKYHPIPIFIGSICEVVSKDENKKQVEIKFSDGLMLICDFSWVESYNGDKKIDDTPYNLKKTINVKDNPHISIKGVGEPKNFNLNIDILQNIKDDLPPIDSTKKPPKIF